MLSSKRDRFVWSKQDRMPDASFFRLLHQNWRPITRVVMIEEQVALAGRRGYRSALKNVPAQSAKPSWNPWLWVGS